jgi:hypothetical protein
VFGEILQHGVMPASYLTISRDRHPCKDLTNAGCKDLVVWGKPPPSAPKSLCSSRHISSALHSRTYLHFLHDLRFRTITLCEWNPPLDRLGVSTRCQPHAVTWTWAIS